MSSELKEPISKLLHLGPGLRRDERRKENKFSLQGLELVSASGADLT